MQTSLENHGLFKITQNIFLLNSNNEFLVLQHKGGKWLLPGGRLEIGENWLEGLKREVGEETGMKDFKVESIFQVDSWEQKDDQYFGVFYVGKSKTGDVKLSEEHIDYKWIKSILEINSLNFWNNTLKDRMINFINSK